MRSVVNLGGGTNSAGVLVGMEERGERPDFIVFADTGGELPRTTNFIAELGVWLTLVGFPPIVRVSKTREGREETLEERCLANAEMPSVVYGHKSCSQRFKAAPIEKWENNEPLLTPRKGTTRKPEDRIQKILGFDIDEMRRATKREDDRYVYRYPLIEWGWGRDECIEAIKRAGLSQPGKSSCFFCPNMEPHEIKALPPEYLSRALEMERRALADPRNQMAGLGRDWSWANLVAQGDLFAPSGRSREAPCDCYDGCSTEDEP